MNGMSVIVTTVIRLTLGFIALFGFYLFFHGHVSHGVGFGGGVILAVAYMLAVLTFGGKATERRIPRTGAAAVMSLGLAAMLIIAVAGIFSGKDFYAAVTETGRPFNLLSAGTVAVSNIALCLATAGALITVFSHFLKSDHKE